MSHRVLVLLCVFLLDVERVEVPEFVPDGLREVLVRAVPVDRAILPGRLEGDVDAEDFVSPHALTEHPIPAKGNKASARLLATRLGSGAVLINARLTVTG